MIRRRVATALCLVLSLTAGTTATMASAAVKKPAPKPKPKCNLVLDDVQNDGHVKVVPTQKSKALDIVSGDVATGPTQMVAVLRVQSATITPSTEPFSVLGFGWSLGTTSTLGQNYVFKVTRGAAGGMIPRITIDGAEVASNKFTFATVGNTYVWTMQRSAAPNLSRPKNVFTQFRATSEIFSTNSDNVESFASTYPDRALSCVPAK